MCTMITEQTPVTGSAKGPQGWFALNRVNIGYDHPWHASLEHALLLDFVNETPGAEARVAVELSPESARQLVATILSALDRGDAEVQRAVAAR